jgi:hypothetical protein
MNEKETLEEVCKALDIAKKALDETLKIANQERQAKKELFKALVNTTNNYLERQRPFMNYKEDVEQYNINKHLINKHKEKE